MLHTSHQQQYDSLTQLVHQEKSICERLTAEKHQLTDELKGVQVCDPRD